jgi:signal transduction histidine kinase
MRPSLRYRLLIVALLSAVSFAISLIALARIVSLTTAQRVERARDTVTQELATLRVSANRSRLPPTSPSAAPEPRPEASAPAAPLELASALVGMRAGYVASPAAFDASPPAFEPATQGALSRAVQAAEASRSTARSEVEVGDATVLVAAAPARAGGLVWVSYALRPPQFVSFWRLIVASLTIATFFMIATALGAVVSVQRGAAALKTSLAAIATDLGAPILRPPDRELSDVADGIAGLARALASAQQEKERLGAELAKRDRLAALGRVVAGVAHEVRNPLASIKLRVDLGRQRQGVPAQLARELACVSDEIQRLDRLVADLLVVSGRKSGPRTETALGTLVRRRVGLLTPWADERGVKIDVSGEEATTELDADAVARAIDNLVRNAVEASPPEATVEIEVQGAADAARVRVMDHGGGVDGARLSELFEPFFTTKPEGTGLGLALSRAVAMAHQGTLTYERRAEVTCFELSFPRAEVRA